MHRFAALCRWVGRPVPCALLVGAVTALVLWWMLAPRPQWRVAGNWKPVAFNADGGKLACVQLNGNRYGGIAVLDTRTGHFLEKHADPRGYALWFFGPDGLLMAVKKTTVVGSHCELELIEVASGKVRGSFRPKGFVPQRPQIVSYDLDFAKVALVASPDGCYVVIGNFHDASYKPTGPSQLNLWTVLDGSVRPPMMGRSHPVSGISFSNDGTTFACLEYQEGAPSIQLRQFHVPEGRPKESHTIVPDGVYTHLKQDRTGRWRVVTYRFATATISTRIIALASGGTDEVQVLLQERQILADQLALASDKFLSVTRTNQTLPPGLWERLLSRIGLSAPSRPTVTDTVRVYDLPSLKTGFQLACSTTNPFQNAPLIHAILSPDGNYIAVGQVDHFEWWQLGVTASRSWIWALCGGVAMAWLLWAVFEKWRKGGKLSKLSEKSTA